MIYDVLNHLIIYVEIFSIFMTCGRFACYPPLSSYTFQAAQLLKGLKLSKAGPVKLCVSCLMALRVVA